MTFSASMDRDDNRQVIQGNDAFLVTKSVTFVAGTTGSVAQHDLFTVTGDCLARFFGICKTLLTSGGVATISAGTANNVAGLIAVTTATDIDANEIWQDATPELEVGALPAPFVVANGADITYDILTATITGGVIDFYCIYRPVSSGAKIVAA